jgi:hypothetical protein
LLCKKNIVAKSEEAKSGCNLAEFSKEDRESKRGCVASADDGIHDIYVLNCSSA